MSSEDGEPSDSAAINEKALKALVREAVALNMTKAKR